MRNLDLLATLAVKSPSQLREIYSLANLTWKTADRACRARSRHACDGIIEAIRHVASARMISL